MSLLNELRNWRNNQARIEGVETFRILPNACLDALVGTLPQNKEQLLSIKGIKEAKFRKYGKVLLEIIGQYGGANMVLGTETEISGLPVFEEESMNELQSDNPLSVSQFLDGLNIELSGMAARIQGEVSSVDERDRVVYFTLKDSKDESTLSYLIFRQQYENSDVKLSPGDEIIVEGSPDIYKPSGRLSLKVGMIELFGEGALKKAYEALKQKLEDEGLFSSERKRLLPEFPRRIALITSEQGAAIGDFTMNLGQQGFQVDFYSASVEGKRAVFEIMEAIRFFNRTPEEYDLLVIVRGGGSLESLQAFNNEALIREVAGSRIVTLCGIGHEKDVPLATLVCDMAVSTPTATARTLREPFEKARASLLFLERALLAAYESELAREKNNLGLQSQKLLDHLGFLGERFQSLREQFLQIIPRIEYSLHDIKSRLARFESEMEKNFRQSLEVIQKKLSEFEETLQRYDPKRALSLGYSLIRKEGKILRSTEGVKKGDTLSLRLGKGRLDSEVT